MDIKKLFKITKNEKKCLKYLIKKKIFDVVKKCHKCKSIMKIDLNEKLLRCQRKGHDVKHYFMNGTFFEDCRIGIDNLLLIVYFYLHKSPTSEIVKMTKIQSEAVTSWCYFLRELLADNVSFDDVLIGGEGIIVEVDETKLGKRKYQRGHIVDGVWVVGGIERTPQKKCFLI